MSNPDAQRESGGVTGGGSGGGTPLDPALRAEVQEWLRWVYEDLRDSEEATRHGERLMPGHACFLAEQCAEKAIKVLLMLDSIPFPRNHDLNALRGLLPPQCQIGTAPIQLSQLAIWAVAARYPGNLQAATADNADEAIGVAREVYELVEHDLARVGITL